MTTTNHKFNRCCTECGEAFGSDRFNAEFCSVPCKAKFNNRRAMRGAELYDVLMNMRYGSGFGRVKGAFTILTALARGYREQDRAERGGRRSWAKLSTRLNEMARIPGVADAR